MCFHYDGKYMYFEFLYKKGHFLCTCILDNTCGGIEAGWGRVCLAPPFFVGNIDIK